MLVFRAKIAVIQRRSSNIVQLQRHVVQAFIVVGVPGLPLVSPLVGGEQCGCVAHPEQDGFECGPYTRMSPMFAEDVGRVDVSRDVVELDGLGGNGLACVVVRECQVSFLEW